MARAFVRVSLPFVSEALFESRVSVIDVAGLDSQGTAIILEIEGLHLPEPKPDGSPREVICEVTTERRTFAFKPID